MSFKASCARWRTNTMLRDDQKVTRCVLSGDKASSIGSVSLNFYVITQENLQRQAWRYGGFISWRARLLRARGAQLEQACPLLLILLRVVPVARAGGRAWRLLQQQGPSNGPGQRLRAVSDILLSPASRPGRRVGSPMRTDAAQRLQRKPCCAG